jgi:hypothetical protein
VTVTGAYVTKVRHLEATRQWHVVILSMPPKAKKAPRRRRFQVWLRYLRLRIGYLGPGRTSRAAGYPRRGTDSEMRLQTPAPCAQPPKTRCRCQCLNARRRVTPSRRHIQVESFRATAHTTLVLASWDCACITLSSGLSLSASVHMTGAAGVHDTASDTERSRNLEDSPAAGRFGVEEAGRRSFHKRRGPN